MVTTCSVVYWEVKYILVKIGVPLAVPVAPVIKSVASGLGLTFSMAASVQGQATHGE